MLEKRPTIAGRKSRNLPVTGLHEWLPQRMLACVIVGVVERLDLSGLARGSDANANPATDPAKLLALLFFGYTSGIFSSRDLEQATYKSETYRFITANTHPHHLVISSFRKCYADEIEKLFVHILGISYMMKQANLGAPRLERKQLEKRLHREASALLKCAEAADALSRNPGRNPQNIPASTATGATKGYADIGIKRPAEPAQAGKEPEHLSSVKTAENDVENSQREIQTFTFLPRKQAVSTLASGVSKAIMAPLFGATHAGITGKLKSRVGSRRTSRQKARNRPAAGVTALLLAGLAAVFLLTLYVDREAPSGSDQASLSGGDNQRETRGETFDQTEFAALTDTILARIDPPQDLALEEKQLTAQDLGERVPDAPDELAPEEQHETSTERTESSEPPTTATLTDAVMPDRESRSVHPEPAAVQRENWIMEQPSNEYMLQLLWGRNQATLLDFVERHQLPEPSAMYKELKNDKTRYVLLYGPYPTHHAALADIQTLPQQVQINRPWPRKLKSIQTIIHEQRGAALP